MAQRRSGGFDLGRVPAGSKGLLISGLLLFVFLFLPWQTVVRIRPFLGIEGRDVYDTAFGSGLGILIAILVLGLLAWEVLLAAGVGISTGRTSPALVSALAGGLVALLTIVLFLTSLGNIAWGAFVGLVAGVAMAYAAYVRYQEGQRTTPPPA